MIDSHKTLLIRVPSFTQEELVPLLAPTDGLGRQINRAKKFALDLLAGVDGTECTIERLGWLVLWSREWGLLIGASQVLESQHRYTIVVLYRAQLELYLQTQLLIEPSLKLDALENHPNMSVKVQSSARSSASEEICD